MTTQSGAHRVRYQLNGQLVIAGSRPDRLPVPGGLVLDGIDYDVLSAQWHVDPDGEPVQIFELAPGEQIS